VAAILNLSPRSVRAIERRGLRKLRRHPAVRQMWKEFGEAAPADQSLKHGWHGQDSPRRQNDAGGGHLPGVADFEADAVSVSGDDMNLQRREGCAARRTAFKNRVDAGHGCRWPLSQSVRHRAR